MTDYQSAKHPPIYIELQFPLINPDSKKPRFMIKRRYLLWFIALGIILGNLLGSFFKFLFPR